MKDPRNAKAMLRENENIFKESKTHLFGKKFRSHMVEIKKSRKKLLEAFKDVGEKKSPFRKGPSHSQNKPHGGGRYCYAEKQGNRDQHKYGRFQSPFHNNCGRKFQYGSTATQGKYLFRKSKGGSFHQQLKTRTNDISDFDTSSSKKIVYRRNAKCTSIGRKAILVCKTVEKNYRQPRIFFNSEGVSDIIHKSPGSGVASKHNKNIRITISASGPENIRVAGEGNYSESRNNLRGVSEQPFSCGKEGWGTKSGDTSEKTKYIHTLRAL